MSKNKGAQPSQRYLLTVPETCDALGISRTTLYALFWEGRLRQVHIGRSVRVAVSDLEAYVASLTEAN